MKTIHPAIAEHAMEENERLRGLLFGILSTPRGSSGRIIIEPDEEADIRSALSRHPETVRSPGTEDTASMDSNSEQEQFTAVDMATAAAQGFRDGQAAVEPAPAQDEHDMFEAWWDGRDLPDAMKAPFFMVWKARAKLATRPAQTEQQPRPVGESAARLMHAYTIGEFENEGGSETVESMAVESYDAKLAQGVTEYEDNSYVSGFAAAMYEQAEPLLALNAAAIAQTAPQHLAALSAVTDERDRLLSDNASLRGSCKALGEENKQLKRENKRQGRTIAAMAAKEA